MTPQQERSIHDEELTIMRERVAATWHAPDGHNGGQGSWDFTGELPEVWCVNDDRPAVVMRMTQRGNEEPEYRALCRDCNWKAQQAAKVKVV